MGSSRAKTTAGPVAQVTTEESILESNLAARDALRRNAMRRGIWNTVKNAGGFRGDQSAAKTASASLIGDAGGTVPVQVSINPPKKKDAITLPGRSSLWAAGLVGSSMRRGV